ncbi:C4-dicarboxylate ABC transporter substrate-binding protein [Sorangium cellulosum]|uniref:C4-dicarboxylate ABC transporter substrate-binding protein n=1 Tax=Sorangium cellulosum TaxID=56 RepID=A0A2L0EY84_SORCE|nr:C4-dicarboxylate ABC transporter substrate-binding protein [Sorangium cellulosum]
MAHRRTFVIAASSLFVASLAAPAEAHRPAYTVRVATPFATGHILADTANKFKELLEAKTNGRIKVQVSTSILNEQTINPAMTSCEAEERVADIMLTGGQPIQDWAPQYFFFNGPYVIRDYEHFQNVWGGELGQEAQDLILAGGNVETLGTVYRGFRQFTSNAPMSGPADFVGLDLRLPPVPDWIAVWSSLGAAPVQVPLTGIYAALEDGAADASEGDLTQIRSLNLHEVQSHLSLTNHLVGFGLVLANECFMDGLSAGDERKIRKTMRRAVKWGSADMAARESTLLAELESLGMTVVTPDAAAIRAAAEPAIGSLFAARWNVTTWREVLSY